MNVGNQRTMNDETRLVWPALLRGARRRCPNCGQGRIFSGYLSVRDECDHCGEEMFHHRADDMHPWITILIVGHLVVPTMLMSWKAFAWPDWVHMTLWPFLVLVLSLAILPLAKGAVIALQWALKMHGFARDNRVE